MKTVLVFGLSGQVGDALLPLLQQMPYEILAISREQKESIDNIVWQCSGFSNFAAPKNYYDIIVSLGPLDAFARWLSSSDIRADKIVVLSSTSVVSKKDSPELKERNLAESLAQSEALLFSLAQQNGSRLIVLRPTLIYGAGRDQSISRFLKFAERFHFVILPSNGKGLRQPVHVLDVADAVINAMRMENTAVDIFDLPGGESLGFNEMLLRSLHAHVPKAKVFHIHGFLFEWLVRITAFVGVGSGLGAGFFARLRQDWVFDDGLARQWLGYRPRRFSP
jgi:nucleoside-diphosphate-sugar epimerase